MLKKIIAALLFSCLQASVTFADTLAAPTSQAATSNAPIISLLKTPTSSRQMHAFSYQPYLYGTRSENQPLVRVKINDVESATFLLDTGSNNSVISDSLADKLKLARHLIMLQGKPSLFEGKPASGVVVDSLELGGFKFAKYLLVVLDKKRIALPNQAIDGILSVDLLQYFDYLFDFPKHQITMLPLASLVTPDDGSSPKYVAGGLTAREIMALGFADAQSAALTKSTQDGRIYVHVNCRNKDKSGGEDLLLDTGAGTTNISPTLADQLDLSPISDNVALTTFGGKKYVSTALVNQFMVGNLLLSNQAVDYSSQKAYDKNVPLSFGMSILSKYQVLIDFANQKVYFKTPPAATPLNITIKTQAAPQTQK